MKNSDKKIVLKNESKLKPTISIDKKLDKFKNVNFVSNKVEEVDRMISKLKLSF